MWFGIVKDFAVNLLLCMSFIDLYVQVIFPSERSHRPWHSRAVYILTQSSEASNAILSADPEYATGPADETTHNVVFAKPVTLAPYSHTPYMVASKCSGLLAIEPKTIQASRSSLQVARNIIEVTPDKPFYVLLANVSETQYAYQST